jgi:hypothetical protein
MRLLLFCAARKPEMAHASSPAPASTHPAASTSGVRPAQQTTQIINTMLQLLLPLYMLCSWLMSTGYPLLLRHRLPQASNQMYLWALPMRSTAVTTRMAAPNHLLP